MEIIRELIKKLPDYLELCAAGLNKASWMNYVAQIDSKSAYINSVALYLRYHLEQLAIHPDITDSETIIQYFEKMHNEGRYAASSLQGKLSILGKCWKFGENRDLNQEAAIIQHYIKNWRRVAPDPVQATPFTAQQLDDFCALPIQRASAHYAAYAVIAAHRGER